MRAELKLNSVNQILKETNIYEKDEQVESISLIVKGRVRMSCAGVSVVVGSGNFLGLCDLSGGVHRVTYTAESDSVIYAFPAMHLGKEVKSLIKANKDYAALMVSTLSKYIRELSKICDEGEQMSQKLYTFLGEAETKYMDLAKQKGVSVNPTHAIEKIEEYEPGSLVDSNKVTYYKAFCEVPSDIQKKFLGVNAVIPVYHIIEQVELINVLIDQCENNAQYLETLAEPLIKDSRSLYINVLQLANTLQHMNEGITGAVALFDDIIDSTNSLENLLLNKCNIDLQIDHEFMEDSYFELINGESSSSNDAADMAITEDNMADISELNGSLDYILDYAELDDEAAQQFKQYIADFEKLSDKLSTEDHVRKIRHGIVKIYYDLYKNIFLKDYNSKEKTPLIIDLFLRYGYLSERLLSTAYLEELLALDTYFSDMGPCKVYDMKEWLTEIIEGRKEPSKSEFDLDYDENLRDMRKTGRITAEEEQKLRGDKMAKFDYEIQNVFKSNHRVVYGQISIFVPFLYTEGCAGSLQRLYLSKDKINAAVQRLLHIDYSAFYRESLFVEQVEGIKKEYIMEEVFPDIIIFPTYGNNCVMWQELSGRKRNTHGRFIVPAFLETDIDTAMIKLFGRFRWELCRTMQGAAWNNIQVKSLTSEYSDFIQFYRKNRELSEDKKEKLKMQIQKCRNNTREVFVIDYENWIKHEAQGGLCLNKPVREILATYCPFVKELRDKVADQPLFRDAMARFNRECGKKQKEYDLKFRVWDKDKVKVPQAIIDTRDYYLNY